MTDRPVDPSADDTSTRRWSLDRRLRFIDFRLQWEGRLNRSDLTEFFGISVPQASLDLSQYQELAPGNAIYDRSSRMYVATDTFQPVYPASHQASRYLDELVATAKGEMPRQVSFIGSAPPVEFVPNPRRALDDSVLAALVRAIRDRTGLRVVYQSLSSANPEPLSRVITPHAFVHDGNRWHVRAFCHKRSNYVDFLIGRILQVVHTEPAGADSAGDVAWHNKLTVVLEADPRLADAQRRIIEREYGMLDGQTTLECREALFFYLVQRLGLDPKHERRPEEQQVVLKNREELLKYLPRSSEISAK
jgi:hypothetical protein